MTNEEIAAHKTRAIILFGFGLAAFVAAYLMPEDTTMKSLVGVAFALVGIVCMVAAGKIAKTLKAAGAAK